MTVWNGERAADLLSAKYSCHYRKTKSANFSVPGGCERQISIALGRQEGVTAYVNQVSVTGRVYPDAGIEGIAIAEAYAKGHRGTNGNPGISVSVATKNSALNPAINDVLRVHVRDEQSLYRLVDWYRS